MADGIRESCDARGRGGGGGGVVLVSVTGGATQRRSGSVAQLDSEQRANAAIIMRAGQDLGLSVRDQAIGVMTAMGEVIASQSRSLDWETSGVRNPDGSPTTSLSGTSNSRTSGAVRQLRLDPYTAATVFYRAMVGEVPEPERTGLAPTLGRTAPRSTSTPLTTRGTGRRRSPS